jgi:hypothetical protein
MPRVRKENSKTEREEGRASEEGTNPFRKSSRTEASRSEEGNKSKEMDNKMKTMIGEIREDTAGIREENKVLRKELAAVRGDERERRKKASGGGRLDGKDENDRGKDGTKTRNMGN